MKIVSFEVKLALKANLNFCAKSSDKKKSSNWKELSTASLECKQTFTSFFDFYGFYDISRFFAE